MGSKDRTKSNINLPPPIIVYGVANIRPVQNLLRKIVGDQYLLKLIANDEVEIQLNDKDKVGLVTGSLKSNNMIFEIRNKNKQGTYKVVLRNMHPSIDTNTIVKELEHHGHKVVSIVNVKNPTTKEPMPLFHIELELRANNEEIYSLTKLSNMIVAFEPNNPRKTSLRCSKCQSYGHRERHCDNVATSTTNSENDLPVLTVSTPTTPTSPTSPTHTPTSTAETPIAYVQPMRARKSKGRRRNASTSSHQQPTAPPPPSAPSAQEQQATLNRLRNLENMVNSTLSSLESMVVLTATLKQRLG